MAPDWLAPGAEVVELTPHRRDNTARVVETTVDRVLKRDVVLANGSRYPVNTLRRSHGTWEPSTELLPADDPKVMRAHEANMRARLLNDARDSAERVITALRQIGGGYRTPEGVDPWADLSAALSTLNEKANALPVAYARGRGDGPGA